VVFAPVFARHHAPQHIGIGHIESTVGIGDLHHIFLIDHHAIGLFELFLKHGVRIDDRRGVVMPADIFAHHTRTGHTRPNNGGRCHQRQVIIATQFSEQLPHGRALDIKTADGIG